MAFKWTRNVDSVWRLSYVSFLSKMSRSWVVTSSFLSKWLSNGLGVWTLVISYDLAPCKHCFNDCHFLHLAILGYGFARHHLTKSKMIQSGLDGGGEGCNPYLHKFMLPMWQSICELWQSLARTNVILILYKSFIHYWLVVCIHQKGLAQITRCLLIEQCGV